MNYIYCFNESESWIGRTEQPKYFIEEKIRKNVRIVYIDYELYEFIKSIHRCNLEFCGSEKLFWINIRR